MRAEWALLPLSLLICGCDNFGTGGTGEMVVPQRELREVQGTRMADLAATQPASRPATRPTTAPVEVRLTVEDVRRLALENNLDIKVQVLNPTIAKQDISQAQAAYEPVFATGVNFTKTDTPTASELASPQETSLTTDTGVRVPLPTGGALKFDLPVARDEINNQFATLNPAYATDFAASISQPLLRGAGLDVNAQQIRIAFYNYQATQAQTKLEVIRVLANADRMYWRLYAARQELEVRKKEYDLAVAQLERARRQVGIGAAAEVEVTRAESGAADRLEAIIVAATQVGDRQRELKRMLNKPGLEMDSPTIIVPASKPNPLYYRLDARGLTDLALRRRMEMLEAELQLSLDAANIRYARNQMLPLVAVQYTYRVNGLGPALGDAFDMLGHKNFEDHAVGLTVEVPIGNEAARSQLRRAMASRLQAMWTKEQRALQIQQEVLDAIGQLEASWQKILAAQKRVVLAARVLDAEVRQFTLGLQTSTDVLDAQAKLADAQSSEIAALTEYEIAQIDIAFATGTLLGASHVVWQPTSAPKDAR